MINIRYPKIEWIGYNRGPRFGNDTSPFLNIRYGRKPTDLGGGIPAWGPWDTGKPANKFDNQSYCAALTGSSAGSKIMDAQCESLGGALCVASGK